MREVCAYHANSGVFQNQTFVGLVGNNANLEVLLGVEDACVRQGHVTNLVECIGSVGDELTKENLLIGVESIDDERKKLIYIRREGEGFSGSRHYGDSLLLSVRLCCVLVF